MLRKALLIPVSLLLAGCVAINVTGVDCDSVTVAVTPDPFYTRVQCAGQTKQENEGEKDTVIDTTIVPTTGK
jgi:hypothetical protein